MADASGMVVWSVTNRRRRLFDLNAHATQTCSVHTLECRAGDVVIWDNRRAMHHGRPRDDSQARDTRQRGILV